LARRSGSDGASGAITIVNDPSSSVCGPGVRSPIEYRSIGLATRKKSGVSYIVTDQNARHGGGLVKRSS
jgi:hypothetical protein